MIDNHTIETIRCTDARIEQEWEDDKIVKTMAHLVAEDGREYYFVLPPAKATT